jgi:hypothetical protein
VPEQRCAGRRNRPQHSDSAPQHCEVHLEEDDSLAPAVRSAAALIDKVAATFARTSGDIPSMIRDILTPANLMAAPYSTASRISW